MKHIQQTLAEIDAARQQYFERDPHRPQGRVRARSRKSDEIKKAETRMRTAAWRNQLDRIGRPESDTVAIQFLMCLIEVGRESGYEVEDLPETRKAFDKLFAVMAERGFQRGEVEAVIKRMTRRAQ